ncbi:hypothetical protein FPOA_11720 [Fusarium poae]|uniref:Uncharacterized protein n=1 Tax=Fusarium poae TaxID=36050 RepID=A0A1B8AHH2_FUSPO|nr:hypothetical protein FPOA_11720 [Fusarium poae]
MAEQVRLQDSKKKFQAAFKHAVSQKEEAEKQYNDDKEVGITNDNFIVWSALNAPAYSAARNEYSAARASYEQALQQADNKGFKDWQEKVKQAARDNAGPNGPDYDTLVGPDE